MLAAIFWISAGLIVYTHLGYPLLLRLLVALRRPAAAPPEPAELPRVSLIVAAYDEEEVIEAKVADALALDYPRERLEIVVASDGSSDATAERARAAGADLVLELPRGGKLATQNAAAERASGEIFAFSDANSTWSLDALRRLVAPFADPKVAYACGQVRFLDADGDNLEGAYWRLEMRVREMESALAGVTAGNGAIYAVRAESYLPLDPSGSHDLSFPFAFAKRGKRSVYVPSAEAGEKVVPTMQGEFARKRRMMAGLWDIVVGERMISPRGYSALYALEIFSHRLLRYLTPFLHVIAFFTNLLLLGSGGIYVVTYGVQVAAIAAGLFGGSFPVGPLRIARYYWLTTFSIAAGLWDRLRNGSPAAWEKAPGTR